MTRPLPEPTARRATTLPAVRVELQRSPLQVRTILHGMLAGIAVAAVATAIGRVLATAHPVAVDEVALTIPPELPGWFVVLARLVSYLGHALVVTPVAVAVSLLAWHRWKTWDLGLLLLVAFGGSTAVTGVIKLLTDRARPDDALTNTLSAAFPSGHAVRAVAVYGLIAWLLWRVSRHWLVRRAAIPLAAGLIAFSGAARVGLGAHWPTDVLSGFGVGAVWLVITLWLIQPRAVTVETEPPAPPGVGAAVKRHRHRLIPAPRGDAGHDTVRRPPQPTASGAPGHRSDTGHSYGRSSPTSSPNRGR